MERRRGCRLLDPGKLADHDAMTARPHSKHAEPAMEAAEWQIAVAYDDARSRERAMRLVHSLQQHFTDDLAFSCTWWKFRYLFDPDIALVARHYASAADIIIFSTNEPGLFPLPVMNWIESWAAARRKNRGVLVPLIGSPNIPSQLYSTKHFYLRHVADRSRMDYLPQSSLATALATLPAVAGTAGDRTTEPSSPRP